MKKIITFVVIIILVLIGLGGYLYYDAFNLAPKRISTRFETVSDSSIPESFDNIQILFISDINYNLFMDYDRFSNIVNRINELNPDIVIFLGDLFAHPSINVPSDAIQEEVTTLLKSIKAPLGKFAVYGEQDLESLVTKQLFDDIMTNADFEILDNENIKLYNKSTTFINLVGLDCPIGGELDIDSAFNNVYRDAYTITICHTPDVVDRIPNDYVNLMLSGHSLGGQFYLPLIGRITKMPNAEKYYRGQYTVNNTLLDVTNGVGTIKYDARLFSDPELVIYQLKHQ